MNDSRHATITAIVPSTGRPSLVRAVESALDQLDVDVAVSIPGTAESLRKAQALLEPVLDSHSERVSFIELPPDANGGRGRAAATDKATSDYVAYLDDDDWWHPRKSAQQVAAFQSGTVLVSCRAWLMNASRPDAGPATIPTQLFDADVCDDVSHYLFRNRRLSAGRNLLHTSTLMVDTASAQAVNWNPELMRHQDWDFVLALASKFGSDSIKQLAEPLAYLETGTASSISAKPDWRPSYDWYTNKRHFFTDAAAADFLVGQVGRYAMQASDYAQAWSLLSEARRRHSPSPSSVAIMLSGFLPRGLFEQMAFTTQRVRQSVSR